MWPLIQWRVDMLRKLDHGLDLLGGVMGGLLTAAVLPACGVTSTPNTFPQGSILR